MLGATLFAMIADVTVKDDRSVKHLPLLWKYQVEAFSFHTTMADCEASLGQGCLLS